MGSDRASSARDTISYWQLPGVTVALASDAAEICAAWRQIFGRHLSAEPGNSPLITLTLRLRHTLPALETGASRATGAFLDDTFPFADQIGALSVHAVNLERYHLRFHRAAAVTIAPGGARPQAAGHVTPLALSYARFEDVTFVALAPLLRRFGLYLLHASAVAHRGKGLLLVGGTRSGKTTTALNLLLHGWSWLANDVVLLRRTGAAGQVHAYPTANEVTVRAPTLRLLPALASSTTKHTLDHLLPDPAAVGRWGTPVPVTLIAFPTVDNSQQTQAEPLHRAIALARLMEQSVDVWDRPSIAAHTQLLETLTAQSATFTLRLGADMQAQAAKLQHLIEETT